MPPVGFEPTISAGEPPQTYALDRAATGTGYFLPMHHTVFFFYVSGTYGLMVAVFYSRNMQPFVITKKKRALLLQIKQRSPEQSIIRTREQQTDGPTEGNPNCTGKYGSDTPHQQLNHSDLKPDGHLPDIKNDSCFVLVTPA